jgi:hypothetical protein
MKAASFIDDKHASLVFASKYRIRVEVTDSDKLSSFVLTSKHYSLFTEKFLVLMVTL